MPSAPKHTRRWCQFTISRILWATFWVALSLGALALLRSDYKEPGQNLPLFIALVATLVLSPFVALGTLFGYPFRGLLAGVILVGGHVVPVSVAIKGGWIVFP
jgi:hypothetical protein